MYGAAPYGALILGGWFGAAASAPPDPDPPLDPGLARCLLLDPSLHFLMPQIPAPYGRAFTHTLEALRDASTGALKTNVALAAGNAELSIDGGAFSAVGVALPTVVNGQWRWAASAAHHTGRTMTLRITNAAYQTRDFHFVTVGDARSAFPREYQDHSSAVSGTPTVNGCAFATAYEDIPDAAFLVELRDDEDAVVALRPATIAVNGLSATWEPALAAAPITAVLAHVLAIPKDKPLTAETIGNVANVEHVEHVEALATGERSNVAAAVRTNLTTELGRIDAAVTTRMATFTYTAPPTAAVVADTVWNRLLTAITTPNSIGERIKAFLGASVYATPPAAGDIASSVLLALTNDEPWDEQGATVATTRVIVTPRGTKTLKFAADGHLCGQGPLVLSA